MKVCTLRLYTLALRERARRDKRNRSPPTAPARLKKDGSGCLRPKKGSSNSLRYEQRPVVGGVDISLTVGPFFCILSGLIFDQFLYHSLFKIG